MTTRIIGTGSYVPEHIVLNDDLAKIVETNDEWIRTRTGISERRVSTGESTCVLASQAARKALENAGIKAEELDLIIVATSTADCRFPSTACEVQAEIGAVRATAFDISAACSGFVFALNTAHSYLSMGCYRSALVIGVDVLSRIVDWKDRATCVLFGDGAGAAVVKASDSGIMHMVMGSDGTKGSVLKCGSGEVSNFLTGTQHNPSYISMDGQEVFKFAVKKVPETIKQLLEESGTDIQEIKYFVLHQANFRIFESIAKRLKVSMDKIPSNIGQFGNTSAATIPIMLDQLNQQGKLSHGDKLVLAGFGSGLTWGATLLEW